MQPIKQYQKEFSADVSSFKSAKPEEQNIIMFDNIKVYVKDSKVHGIGVFARQNIKKEEIVEIFPIVPMSFRTNYQGDARVLDYGTIRFCECEECKRHGYIIYSRLGYGGIYNHQDKHNSVLGIDFSKNYGKCTAIEDIEKDDEIFINYGDQYIFREGKNTIRE
jgi:SET domain-containing protein